MMPDTKAAVRKLLLVYGALPLAYVIVGRLGLVLAVSPGYATAIFLPAGIALAAAFMVGLASLPGIFVGSLLLNLSVTHSIGYELDGVHVAVAVIIASASSLQAAAGGLALRKCIGYPAPLDNPRDLLLFLLLAPFLCLISAAASICGMWALGVLSSADSAVNLWTWWIGDTLGILVGLPLTFVLAGEPRRLWQYRGWSVALPMILGLALLVAVFIHFESHGLSGGFHTEARTTTRVWQDLIITSAGTLSIGLLGALLMLGTGYGYRIRAAKEEELEAVLHATPFMLTRCSRELRFRFVSESYAAMFGRRPEDLVGKPIAEVIGKEAFQTVLPHVEKVLGGNQAEYEARITYRGVVPRDIRFVYTPDRNERGEVVGWVASLLDVTDQKQAQEREAILLLEIQHRSNNLLAVIQAIAHQSFARSNSLEEAKTAFESRLQALARVDRQLMQSNWQGVDLREIVRQELEPFADRSTVDGVKVVLGPKQAQNFSLALHELATNASKYGALSNGFGRVEIAWTITGNGGGHELRFRWREQGGPTASEPSRLGFGTALLRATFPGIALHYAPQGFSCEIELPLKGQGN